MKIWIVAVCSTLLSLSACRKERSCSCTVTKNGVVTTHSQSVGFPPLVPGIDESSSEDYKYVTSEVGKYEKVRKKDMHSLCPVSASAMIFEETRNSAPGVFTITVLDSGTVSRSCEIM